MRLAWLVVWGIFPLYAQNYGSPTPFSLNATDVYSQFRLPPLKDGPGGPLTDTVSSLQVVKRARALGLSSKSAVTAWTNAEILVPVLRQLDQPSGPSAVTFTGTTASALNRAIDDDAITSIRVAAPTLTVDQPIEIRRNGLLLDLATTLLTPATSGAYLIRIEGAANVVIQGGTATAGSSAVLVSAAANVVVRDMQIRGLNGDGIVVTGSSRVLVSRNRISGLKGAPVVLHRGTATSVVDSNDIFDNKGPSNVTAGIVITDREVDLSSDPAALFGPDGYWVASQPIVNRLHPPHDNVILGNRISGNVSSGVYVDGGTANVIVSNNIERNGKEGLCLDNGSTANVVANNSIQQNGQRWGESDAVLTADCIAAAGRLPNGTAAAKVPGVSVDNAIYNLILSNEIWRNFGGGVKIVRTGYFNVIGMNTLFNNNEGASNAFHFFGIELGAAPGDTHAADLDYTPSRGNIVFSNPIRGNHYSGIFFAAGSDDNDVFDNVIMDAQEWALESATVMSNNSLNNLTNLRSRNIGSGLDPVLLTIGQF